jgi:hypothetical protein
MWDSSAIREGNILFEILTRSAMIPRDFLAHRDCYAKVGYYSDQFETHEDWDLKIRLARFFEFYYTGIDGIAYRRHGTGLSSINYPLKARNKWDVFHKNLLLLDESYDRELIVRKFSEFMYRRNVEYEQRMKGWNRFTHLYSLLQGAYRIVKGKNT